VTTNPDIADLQRTLRAFADERDWHQFHTPKNLAMALGVEAAELIEIFQWLTPDQSFDLDADQRHAASAEMADVFIYLLRLADVLDVDLIDAARAKIAVNAQRYPASVVRGSARKHREPNQKS